MPRFDVVACRRAVDGPMPLSRRQLLKAALGGGLGAAGLWMGVEHQNPMARAADRGDLHIGLISDLNSRYGSTSYIPQVGQGLRQLLGQHPQLLVCAGDMIAGQKRGLSSRQLDAMWDAFARQVLQPVRQAGVSFLPAVGNHDGAPGFAADRAAARRFWGARRQALGLNFRDPADFPFHYSALQDDVFWLVWDASSSRLPADQLRWAQRQLASPAARQAQLRMVVGHLPLFGVSQGRDRPGEMLEQAAVIRDLLENGGVQAYISGHQHAWYPARLGQLDLIQLGAMGSGPRRLISGSASPKQTFTTLTIDWTKQSLNEATWAVSSGRPIPWTSLPKSLTGRRARLERNTTQRRLRHD